MLRSAVLLVVALLIGAVALPATAADAATSNTHPRATTLLASSRYIVYLQKTSSTNVRPLLLTGGSVYAADAAGRRQSLPGFTNTKEFLYLTGSVLVQAQNQIHSIAERQKVRWRDLDTRTTGVVENQPGTGLVAAAPDGWVMERSTDEDGIYGNPQQLTYVRLDGSSVDLGEPFPKGQSFGLSVSDTGILATPGTSDEAHFASQVRFRPWTGATTWRTVYTTPVSKTIWCAPSSSGYAACTMGPADTYSGATTTGLVALDGRGARWIQTMHPKACGAVNIATSGSDLVAVETSDAGVCTKGELFRFSWNGALASGGSHHYSSTGILAGLGGKSSAPGKVIVSNLDQRHVDTLVAVTKPPVVLVRV